MRYRFLVRWNFYALIGLLVGMLAGGCSIKKYAINKVGDALASGESVYQTDEDPDLVGEALPFALKLTESLLAESPNHRGLLLTACRGFVLYSYGYVDFPGEVAMEEDLERGRALRTRARRLYLRGLNYCLRGMEQSYAGFREGLLTRPRETALLVSGKREQWDVPFLYWTSASLGLAVSVSKGDASMLARLPEVEALLDRALEIDEDWDEGLAARVPRLVGGGQARRSGCGGDYEALRACVATFGRSESRAFCRLCRGGRDPLTEARAVSRADRARTRHRPRLASQRPAR